MLKAKRKKKEQEILNPARLLFGATPAEQSTPQEKPIANSANGPSSQSDFHECYAELASGERCSIKIPRNMLMCNPHWQMVPARIQALVYEYYKPLANPDDYSTVTNMAYRNAIAAARQHVKEKLAELKQAGPRPDCPFCFDKGIADEDRASGKYCLCDAGLALLKKREFQQRPLRKKDEKVYDSIPFGKHKGTPLEDLPIDYLQWAYENWDDKGDGLYSSIANALYDRVSEVKT